TGREPVLAITAEYGPEPRRREPPSLSETAIGRCRYAITLPAGERVTPPPGWACLMLPSVRARVETIGEGRFRYRYAFRNGEQAKNDIWSFSVDLPRGDIVLDRSDASPWLLLDLHGAPVDLGRPQQKIGRAAA